MNINLKLDLSKKSFQLSAPVFCATSMPKNIQNFIDARKNHNFQPHATAFQKNTSHIALVQEISFNAFFRSTLRRQLAEFKKMVRSCKKMFTEMDEEESLQEIIKIISQ